MARKLLWFAGLYLAGIAALGAVALVVHLAMPG